MISEILSGCLREVRSKRPVTKQSSLSVTARDGIGYEVTVHCNGLRETAQTSMKCEAAPRRRGKVTEGTNFGIAILKHL